MWTSDFGIPKIVRKDCEKAFREASDAVLAFWCDLIERGELVDILYKLEEDSRLHDLEALGMKF